MPDALSKVKISTFFVLFLVEAYLWYPDALSKVIIPSCFVFSWLGLALVPWCPFPSYNSLFLCFKSQAILLAIYGIIATDFGGKKVLLSLWTTGLQWHKTTCPLFASHHQFFLQQRFYHSWNSIENINFEQQSVFSLLFF